MESLKRMFRKSLLLPVCILILSGCGKEKSSDVEMFTGIQEIETIVSDASGGNGHTGEMTNASEMPLPIQDVDWEAYQGILSEDDYEALECYLKVLTGEDTFTWIVPENAGLDWEEKAVAIDEFRYILNNELWDAGYDPDELWVNSIALCDMNADGSKELILYLDNIGGHYLILHKEGDTFYGMNNVYRALQDLQTNGVYSGSGGASTTYYYRLEFADGKVTQIRLGYTDWDAEKETSVYYIGDAEQDKETFKSWVESIKTESVTYYAPMANTSIR